MAFASRRLAAIALGSALAVVSGLAGPVDVAAAADPVTSSPAPTLLGPADDPAGANPVKDLVLSWSPVATADSYQVQISPNGDWTNNTVTLPKDGKTVNTVYEVPISLPHSFYYWRVRGFHDTAHTAWSSSRQFLREWYAPFQMLKLPTSSDPTVSWQPVAGASVYRVRFGTRPDFSTTGKNAKTFTCYTQQTTFTPYATNMAGAERLEAGGCFDAAALTDGETYYWEVIAYDDTTDDAVVADTSNDAGWECAQAQPECNTYLPHANTTSPSFDFQAIDAGAFAGGVPTGLKTSWHAGSATSTDCTTATCPMTPTFSWNAVTGANYYEVHVWRDPAHLNTYRVYDTSTTSVTPREGLFDAQAGSGYYWSVAAGTCMTSAAQKNCSQAADATTAPSPSCQAPATVTTPPSVDSGATGLTAAPAGPKGAQSMTVGASATITLTGTGFVSGACVAASSSGGTISNIKVVDANHVTFDYDAASSAMSVTFTVVNADGGTSNASPPLDVFADDESDTVVLGPLSGAATFKKASGAVDLLAPADGTHTDDASITFDWNRFINNGGQGAYDARNYHLQVASDADFDHVVWDNPNIDLTQYTNADELLPDGTWFWRVQGIDESGNPLTWSPASSFTKDSTSPAFQITSPDGVAVNGAVRFASTETVGGVASSTVRLVPATGGRAVAGKVTRTGSRTWKLQPSSVLETGQVYRLAVSSVVRDASGNAAQVTGSGVRTATQADDKSPALRFSGSWSRHASSQALGGTFSTASAGHSVKVTVAGSKVKLFACRGPQFGELSVLVDGARKATVNEHHGYTTCGVLLWKGTVSASAPHTVRLVAANGTGNLDQVQVG